MRKKVLSLLSGILSFVFFFTCFFNMFTKTVHAYIDPSVATYLIQAIAGVLVALGAILTVFRHKIFAFFKKKDKNVEEENIELKDVED